MTDQYKQINKYFLSPLLMGLIDQMEHHKVKSLPVGFFTNIVEGLISELLNKSSSNLWIAGPAF